MSLIDTYTERPTSDNRHAIRSALLELADPKQTDQASMPSWLRYDATSDVLTIHGKRYSATIFGEAGFLVPAGTLLRVVAGPADVVTLAAVETGQKRAEPQVDQKVSYRLLTARDTIEPDDEYLQEDCTTWVIDPKGIFVGMRYQPGSSLRVARRRASKAQEPRP